MKKLISLALVLVMMLAVACVSFAAQESPEPDNYYSVEVGQEGQGTASADKIKVNPDGTVTLTATENGGYFTKWIITGDYLPVEGDEYSPVFTIKPAKNVTAIASFSVEKDFLTISQGEVIGDGTITIDPTKIAKGTDGTVTLTAVDGKDTFARWILACEYEIVEGSLTSRTLVIKPLTDVHVTAEFTANGEPATEPAKTDSNTSPKTGDPTFMIITMIMLAMALGTVAVKKIKE